MIEQEPLVSVLMTTFNREKYVAYAVESVLKSTYRNIELIITDDGSKDDTVNIIKGIAERDKRVKIHVNKDNLGDYPNRNKAASYAQGKYLKYVDADDYIYPWGVELLVKIMESFPDAGFGLCSLEQDEYRPFPFMLTGAEIFEYEYFGPGLFHKAPLSSIIKKDAFESIGGFSGKKHLGDYELWHLLSCKFPVVLMPHGIVWHRIHDEQQSMENRIDPEVPFKYIISAANFFENCDKIPVSVKKRDDIRRMLRRRINRSILHRIRKGHFSIAYKLYRATKKREYSFASEVL